MKLFALAPRYLIAAVTLLLSLVFSSEASASVPRTAATTCYEHYTCLELEAGTAYTNFTILWQGVARDVLVIYPTTATTPKAPALVLLHAKGVGTTLMANMARASRLASQLGYWVVLPAAKTEWDVTPNQVMGNDDIGFITAVTSQISTQYPIDTARISISGFSKGAYLSELMACLKPELFASAAIVAGTMTGPDVRACMPSRPVPMLYIMGTADPQVAYNGTYGQYSAAQDFNYWLGMHACDSSKTMQQNLPILVQDTTSVILQSNSSCTSGGEVDLYTVVNGGHTWSGGTYTPTVDLGIISQNLDATMVIGNFAKKWTTASTH